MGDYRRLVLARHAKTEKSGDGEDHERSLLPRGELDAASAGEWLVGDADLVPDLVLCSTARRALQTWTEMARHPRLADVRVQADPRLYNAPPVVLLEVLREAPEAAEVVLLVGHAPGVPALVAELADRQRSQAAALQALDAGFPTMACAVLEPAASWADLGPGTAALPALEVPRGR